MRFQGFIGPAYTLRSDSIECQRLVNLYPEMNEAGTGKEGEVAHYLSTPGLNNLIEVGQGPMRLQYTDPRGTILVVSGDELYKLSYSGSIWSSTLLGELNTSNGAVIAASNKLANGDTITVFVDGEDSYTYEYVSSAETFDDYAGRSYQQVDGATHVDFIDGYFIFNKPDSGEFFVSEWGSFNVDPLSFATAEGDPDNLVALKAMQRDLWLFGQKSIEVFVNSGNVDFPFERVSGGFIEKGCAAPYSVAKLDGVMFWLGRDLSGQGIVYAAKGLEPQRISTHAIEASIQGYAIDSIQNATSYTYHEGGHSFYVLNFSEATWVFDLTTKLWHERAYNNEGNLERHRASVHAFVPQLGLHLVGDYALNAVYALKHDVYADDGAPIIRLRSSPHVSSGGTNVFCKSFQLDMEAGVGLDGGAQGSDPQVVLDWSDDGGHTWSNELWASAGAIGKKKTRVKWFRLGRFRDRVFRIRITDAIKVVILGAEIDLEKGAS